MLSIRDLVLEGGDLSDTKIEQRKIADKYFEMAMEKIHGTEKKDVEKYIDISTRFSRQGVEVA